MIGKFEQELPKWVATACKDWAYPHPANDYYDKAFGRLPVGLRSWLSLGIDQGLIIIEGRQFSLKDLPPEKGPYNWFSRYSSKKEPAPNWEYFIQVAEYVRLFQIAKAHGLTLTFEDDLMDLALYQDGRLLVCYEVKEKASQIKRLVSGIKTYQKQIDYDAPDRGNDPLRKAKYLAKKRPAYFSGVAIGARLEYQVEYPEGQAFQLVEDFITFS